MHEPPVAALAFDSLEAWLDALPGQACVLDGLGRIVARNQAWQAFVDEAMDAAAAPEATTAGSASHPGDRRRTADDLPWDESAAPTEAEAADRRRIASALQAVLAGECEAFRQAMACATPQGRRWFSLQFRRVPAPPPSAMPGRTGAGAVTGGADAALAAEALGAAAGRPRVLVLRDDITEQHEAQAALRQREALLADLAASVPGAIFRLLQPARGPWYFVYLSPGFTALTELAPAAVCADRRLFDRLVAPEDRATVASGIARSLATGETWSQAYRVRGARSGQLRWLRVVARPGQAPAPGEPRPWTGLISDITEAHAVEQALREREQTYRTLFDTVPQGVVYQDTAGRITAANPAAQRILGLNLDQLQGRTSVAPRWQTVREDGSPLPGSEHPAMLALRTGQPVTEVVMGVHVPERGMVWIQVGAIPILRDGVLQQVYSSFEDITEQVRLREELRRQASTDPLTGVANRRSLVARLGEEFAHARRHPDRVFSVLAVDVDLFKQVNDNWGHAAGDAALVHLARTMQRQTRPSDLVGRSGGEEFMVLMRDTPAPAAQALAERLRRAVARSVLQHDGVRLRLSVSIGVAALQPGDDSIDPMLARADRALYAAKHAGRNRVCVGED